MTNPFSLSDEKLKELLDSYFLWIQGETREAGYIDSQKQRDANLKKTLLSKDFLANASQEELTQTIFDYSRTLEGPAYIRLGEPRIKNESNNIKRNILYLIESDDDPYIKATQILEGKLRIPIFARSFWTPLFQVLFPSKLPNWNNKTEMFLHKVGIDLKSSKLSTEEKYKQISEAFSYLEKLDSRHDFYTINHLMHYGTYVPEGNQLIDRLYGKKPEEKKEGISIKKRGTSFEGFSEATFDLLDQLSKDTSYEAVKAISEMIHEKVVYPLKDIFLDIAQEFDKREILNLEKKKRVTANLFKMNPRLGAWPYIWGALYQKEKTRPTSMQFYIWMSKDALAYGIYPSKNQPDIREKIIRNLERYGEHLKEYTTNDFFDYFSFYSDYVEGNGRDFFKAKNSDDLISFYRKTDLNVGKILSPKEVIQKGKSLVDLIREDFEKLIPLYIYGITDEPVRLLELYYEEKEDPPEEPISKESILSEIFIEEENFDRIISLLESGQKKQIILQGPPGTGKTYIAQRIARYLTNSEDRIETIQFHASYSYEDFIEGFRPTDDGSFRLQDGIFKNFCKRAKISDPEKIFVLNIDEINRGNLSKIFGELLYLLEYRDQEVQLSYSRESFSIPENLYIIGTMNTADRSLAIMDYALRRRFYFINLYCQTERLGIWLMENGCTLNIDDIIARIVEMNKQISYEMQSGDFCIGHSYFMKENLGIDKYIELVEFEIKPLLQEYFFDKQEKIEEILKTIKIDVS